MTLHAFIWVATASPDRSFRNFRTLRSRDGQFLQNSGTILKLLIVKGSVGEKAALVDEEVSKSRQMQTTEL